MTKVGNVIRVLNAVGTTQIGKGYFVPGVSVLPEYGNPENSVIAYSAEKAREVISKLRSGEKTSKLNILTQNNVPLEVSIDDRCVVILSEDKGKGKEIESALEGTGFNFRYPTEPDDELLKGELLS